MDERRLKFVLAHYREGTKTAREALVRVYEKAGLARHPLTLTYSMRYAFAAAAVAASLLLVIFISGRRQNAWTEYIAETSKAIVTLSDGSVATLAPGAVIRLQERKDPRHVELVGNAYFEVFHDESRPFTVSAGTGNVKVLGTKFLISSDDDGTIVDVTEGKVMFSSAGQSDGLILTEGMSASAVKGERMPELLDKVRLNPAAWATGTFIYDRALLGDALRELASYYDVRLEVEPESASSMTFNGKFSTESIEDIIYSLETALGIKIAVK